MMNTSSRPIAAQTRLRRNLRYMLGDGTAFSVMVGIGESYVAPFALAMGFGDVAAGLVATVPMLIGAVLQLVTPAAVGWLGSHKRWVVLCASLQAASFVPLIAGALAGTMPIAALYLTASLYWALGMATGPAWNTWAGALVPRSIRAGYFARRSRWSQAALLAGLGAGAILLEQGGNQGRTHELFAIVFGCALVARVVSTSYLARQSEPRPVAIGDTRISPVAILDLARREGHGRLFAYLFVFQMGVWIAAPYFTPYILGPLGLDYPGFAWLTGVAFLSRVAVFPWLGRLARARGTFRVLQLGSLGIVPLPVLWLVSDSLVWLTVLQLASGAAWAAFELATLLSFFERIPEASRTSMLSAYNLMNAAAIAIGSGIGALLLVSMGAGAGTTGFAVVLVTSTLARGLSLVLLRGLMNVPHPDEGPLEFRTLGLRPSSGAVQRPILATLPDQTGRDQPTD